MKLRHLVFAVLVCLCSTVVSAQGMVHSGNSATAPTVDGARNPEKIPDEEAYFLYFYLLTTGANPTPQQLKVQQNQIREITTDTNEAATITYVLNDFRVQFDSFEKTYNDAATAANNVGLAYDTSIFVTGRDALVQKARTSLSILLSMQTNTNVHAIVQKFKRNVKLYN